MSGISASLCVLRHRQYEILGEWTQTIGMFFIYKFIVMVMGYGDFKFFSNFGLELFQLLVFFALIVLIQAEQEQQEDVVEVKKPVKRGIGLGYGYGYGYGGYGGYGHYYPSYSYYPVIKSYYGGYGGYGGKY